jgi:hypothetical protein
LAVILTLLTAGQLDTGLVKRDDTTSACQPTDETCDGVDDSDRRGGW